MSYFLRKTNKPKGTYLQIVEGHRDPLTKKIKQTIFKTLGYVESLKEDGIEDPIAYYSDEVRKLNLQAKETRESQKKNIRKIGDVSPIRHAGYFPIRKILDGLKVRPDIEYLASAQRFEGDPYSLMSALLFAHITDNGSGNGTFHESLANLVDQNDASYDQMLGCCEFIGGNYDKIAEIFTERVRKKYGIKDSQTSFFLEMDSVLLGEGMLLDEDLLPVGLGLNYEDPFSEPDLEYTIRSLKAKSRIKGRTIHVAEREEGLAVSIDRILKDDDGYIFFRTIDMPDQDELAWAGQDQTWLDITNPEGKVKYRYKECIGTFAYEACDADGNATSVQLKEKRMIFFSPQENGFTEDMDNVRDTPPFRCTLLATSEYGMPAARIIETCQSLHETEESFRDMESSLVAHPVFGQSQDSFHGHLLLCYIETLLIRILQLKVLDNKYDTYEIMGFMKRFNVLDTGDRTFINLVTKDRMVDVFSSIYSVNLNMYYLKARQLKALGLMC